MTQPHRQRAVRRHVTTPACLGRLALIVALAATALQAGAAAPSPLDRMAWLVGCWQIDGADPGSDEQWMAPAGGSMLGMGRTVAKGRTAAFEFMQLRVDSQGRLIFIAQPGGQPGTTFVQAASSDEQTTAFENPRTDFPQRVVYQQRGPDRLLAWIDGVKDGKPAKVDFPMSRVVCARGALAR